MREGSRIHPEVRHKARRPSHAERASELSVGMIHLQLVGGKKRKHPDERPGGRSYPSQGRSRV